MSQIKENKLILHLQLLSEECSMFNLNLKQLNEIRKKINSALDGENKETPAFEKALDQLMNEVKKLISATEDLNLNEAEKRAIQAKEQEALRIHELKLREIEEQKIQHELKLKEAERQRILAEKEAMRIQHELKLKEAERQRVLAEQEAKRIKHENKLKEAERQRVAEQEAKRIAEIKSKEVEQQNIALQEAYENKMKSDRRTQIEHAAREISEIALQANFPKPDVADHVPNYISAAFICNIVNAEEGLFNILQIADKPNIPKFHLGKLTPLAKEPSIGTIFVRKTPNGVPVRAQRVLPDTDTRNMKVLILETGEFSLVKFNTNDFFELPEKYRKVPAFAHLCKLVQYTSPKQTMAEYINASLRKRIDYKVLQVEKAGTISKLYDVVIIKLLPTLLPELVSLNGMKIKEGQGWLKNPFLTDKPPLQKLPIAEEPLSPMKIKFPEIGTLMWIEPLQVEGLDQFYAHLIPETVVTRPFGQISGENPIAVPVLTKLLLAMNSDAAVKRMKPYNDEKKGDMVIGSFEGIFYRARIVAKEIGYCVLFFVDFGSEQKVKIANIRQYEKKYSPLAFQAIMMKIGNVQYDENKDNHQMSLGIATLSSMIRAKPIPARLLKVVNGGEYVEIRVFNKNGEDIGEILVNEGYAKPRL